MYGATSFGRKSYGAIFTDSEENIESIRSIIKEMDEFEYEYLPKDMVREFCPTMKGNVVSVPLCYTHKFDSLNLNELMLRCWQRGIRMWYIIGESSFEDATWFMKNTDE